MVQCFSLVHICRCGSNADNKIKTLLLVVTVVVVAVAAEAVVVVVVGKATITV